ncbi:MAG: ABC transporter permease [Elusimicrobiales bacterium]
MSKVLRGFIIKELRQSLRDKRMRALIFLVPVVQLAVFGFALSSEAKNIRLLIARSPGDRLAARLEERAGASGWFAPAKDAPDGDYARLVESGGAEAVLVMPPGGPARAAARGGAKMQLLVDASNPVRAREVERYVKAVVSREMPPGPPPSLDIRVLYNPAMESALFMVPGVMSMILCLITVIVTSMAVARERESGTMETLLSAPVSPSEIIAGKTVPYILLGFIEVPLIMAAAYAIFGVPLRGPAIQMALAGLAFVFVTVNIGALISTFAATQQQAMMGGFMFLFPAMLLSGIMFPVENIPPAARWAAYLDPLMYFAALARNILLKGGDWGLFLRYLGALAVMGAAAAWAARRRFKSTL